MCGRLRLPTDSARTASHHSPLPCPSCRSGFLTAHNRLRSLRPNHLPTGWIGSRGDSTVRGSGKVSTVGSR